mgnify:CR=1 FL=1
MNITKATQILEDLKQQQKVAQEQFVLLTGAVQGAETVLAALQEVETVPKTSKEKSKLTIVK